MSESYEIASSSGSYSVQLGRRLLESAIARYSDAIFVVDAALAERLPAHVKRVLTIEATEANKALEAAPRFVAELRRLEANRDTHLVVIGGGTIQDIATFLASIYMRGVSWTYLPTTVLSMADSCIGGKSSINVLGFKNLVGNFFPPRDIVIDLEFITTLDREMIVGGLFEAAKICYAHSAERFSGYLAAEPSGSVTPDQIEPIVSLALQTKKWFIETDEFDQKERLLLNFGHTFGHAIEAASNFSVSHGVAVGAGMLIACEFARQIIEMSEAGVETTGALCRHIREMLGQGADSAVAIPPALDLKVAMQKFEYDKKHKTENYRVVIPDCEGRLTLASVARDDATRGEIERAYHEALNSINWPVTS
jgi:3-dehydroquinate synthase